MNTMEGNNGFGLTRDPYFAIIVHAVVRIIGIAVNDPVFINDYIGIVIKAL